MSSSSTTSSSSSSSSSPCAACKVQRRKCVPDCIFAPYFPPDHPEKFVQVQRVFGASNVGKILKELKPADREAAVNSLVFEANAQITDPVYGCVGYIYNLQNKLRHAEALLHNAKLELATYIGGSATAMLPPQQQMFHPAAACFLQQQPPPNHNNIFGSSSSNAALMQQYNNAGAAVMQMPMAFGPPPMAMADHHSYHPSLVINEAQQGQQQYQYVHYAHMEPQRLAAAMAVSEEEEVRRRFAQLEAAASPPAQFN